jgi:hypothetical protein
MPNTYSRDSLVKTLEDRYNTQTAGGAFNAKNIQTNSGAVVKTNASLQNTLYSKDGGFTVKQTQTDYKAVQNGQSVNVSLLSQGLNTKRYK